MTEQSNEGGSGGYQNRAAEMRARLAKRAAAQAAVTAATQQGGEDPASEVPMDARERGAGPGTTRDQVTGLGDARPRGLAAAGDMRALHETTSHIRPGNPFTTEGLIRMDARGALANQSLTARVQADQAGATDRTEAVQAGRTSRKIAREEGATNRTEAGQVGKTDRARITRNERATRRALRNKHVTGAKTEAAGMSEIVASEQAKLDAEEQLVDLMEDRQKLADRRAGFTVEDPSAKFLGRGDEDRDRMGAALSEGSRQRGRAEVSDEDLDLPADIAAAGALAATAEASAQAGATAASESAGPVASAEPVVPAPDGDAGGSKGGIRYAGDKKPGDDAPDSL